MSAPAIITALIALTLFGQPQGPKRPDAAGRSVYTFDFEERLSNPNPVPRNWSRVYDQAEGGHRPLLPPWNQAELAFTGDGQAAASGEGYVRLPTQGGGTRLLLDSGVVPVFAGADYLVTAKVRTDGLARARAARGPIPGSLGQGDSRERSRGRAVLIPGHLDHHRR